jgi:D-cysteine desulfhydrase
MSETDHILANSAAARPEGLDRRALLGNAARLAAVAALASASGCDVPADAAPDLSLLAGNPGQDRAPRLAGLLPDLRRYIPWLPLADALPTPVERLEQAGRALGIDNFWIKRDDRSSTLYGGNKVRKLEFLLADALSRGATRIITMGGIGSHHCCATTAFAATLGLPTTIVQTPQPLTDHVRRQLLLDAHHGAQFRLAGHEPGQIWAIRGEMSAERARGGRPHFIWAGGSSALGTLGFVEAALELAGQIRDGALPEPAAIFVATGSGGSHAGLLLGLRLAGIRSRVIGVRVVPGIIANDAMVDHLASGALRRLQQVQPDLKVAEWSWADIEILTGHMGPGYGHVTEESLHSQRIMLETEGIALETTYTAKTVAAMAAWSAANRGHGPLLFWDTFSSTPLPDPLPDPSVLPADYQRFFSADHSGT